MNALVMADSVIMAKDRQLSLERSSGGILRDQRELAYEQLAMSRKDAKKQATLKWIGFGGALGGTIAGPTGAVVGGIVGWVFGKLIPAN